MIEAGWVEEVARLLEQGIRPEQHCFKALGYREVIGHLRGELTLNQMRERIIIRTQQFAKRQMVWFRRERPALWLRFWEEEPARLEQQLEKLLELIGTSPI